MGDKKEYNRFVEVLSDRASIAQTIEFESELKAEEKAEQKAELKVQQKVEEIVRNLLALGNMTDEQIAGVAQVSLEFVRKVKEEMR